MRIFRQWLMVLFGLAFLNANALGAHLHLCFDGQEPGSSLHILDETQDLDHTTASSQHHDVDVKLTDNAVSKLLKFQLSIPAVPTHWAIPPTDRAIVYFVALDGARPQGSGIRELLPPQRGPPA